MNQQKSLVRISELLSRFQVQVGILNANHQLDINIVAQDVLIPIFKEVFNSPNLFNADHGLAQSFPAVDLIDLQAKISFQITSTAKVEKIRKTLEKIVEHHSDKFDWKHYIYIITQKLDNYESKMIEQATENKFAFDKTHILDVKDLFELISALSYEKIRTIENYLETQFSDYTFGESKMDNLLEDLKNKLKNESLNIELEGLRKAKLAWLKKKMFFEEKLPSTIGSEEFSCLANIETSTNKLNEYNQKIALILNQLS